ncbi:DUF2931 family protein [Yersinia similis]|uniref:Lipoprotein n=1 Tax=Yersinia similis TaxID=367190 RepID=A0A0T9RBZ4_9GAMM|nr:DUF2931 family protein [Yersinia similis]AHK18593.1 hypothetical protein BF17_03955 [Yersinia similis]CFQ70144.1 lipoprotein [Yersinia similis]CNC28241.1 lipoprotein [Yersinia similis]CNF55255.1 lipoprotein [Yersinia similis]CNG40754.1 lipoprotein [Yersinia similis]
MKIKRAAGLTLILILTACQNPPSTQSAEINNSRATQGKWNFTFVTPESQPAQVTYARIVDTAGNLHPFNTRDMTQNSPSQIGESGELIHQTSVHFNQTDSPPQSMVFCWNSIADKKVYETHLVLPQSVRQSMIAPARTGNTAQYKTMLFGLAPGGKVLVWLQDEGGLQNKRVPIVNINTLSGDKLAICRS